MTKPRTRYNRRQGQGFIGIRSGLTGETVIMLPVWAYVPGERDVAELRVRLSPEYEVEPDVLGSICRDNRFRREQYIPTVYEADGTQVQLAPTITNTDGAMDILQYLSDACDPRLWLGYYSGSLAVDRPLRGDNEMRTEDEDLVWG